MTDQLFPITPPPELVQQWLDNARAKDSCKSWMIEVATQAANWGADTELEACCEWLEDTDCDDPQEVAEHLCAARRPKPPSLKERALQALENFELFSIWYYSHQRLQPADGADHPVVATVLTAEQHALIRRALETLDD